MTAGQEPEDVARNVAKPGGDILLPSSYCKAQSIRDRIAKLGEE